MESVQNMCYDIYAVVDYAIVQVLILLFNAYTDCRTHSPDDIQGTEPSHALLTDQCSLCRKCGDTGACGDLCKSLQIIT